MEQTLGKRIMEHRKRLGLTQDALAEQLGITAQAVSKWENDLSCPDITMLPKLAEIFGVSTDQLLGREEPEKVYRAEVVDDEEDAEDGVFNLSFSDEEETGKWSFQWDSGRRHALTFAVFVLLVGVLYFLTKWYAWDVSFWNILWPSALLIFGLGNAFLPKFSLFNLAGAIFGGYFLVQNLGFWKLDIAGELIFPICIVLFGLSLLIDALRKPKKPRFRVVKKGGNKEKTKIHCENNQDYFTCNLSFGNTNHIVVADQLKGGNASVSFGDLIIDLSEVTQVSPNCEIEANVSFGEITFRVPQHIRIECSKHTAFGDVSVKGHPDPNADTVIYLTANASFGEICIQYI